MKGKWRGQELALCGGEGVEAGRGICSSGGDDRGAEGVLWNCKWEAGKSKELWM